MLVVFVLFFDLIQSVIREALILNLIVYRRSEKFKKPKMVIYIYIIDGQVWFGFFVLWHINSL